jgi:hypothetical protein
VASASELAGGGADVFCLHPARLTRPIINAAANEKAIHRSDWCNIVDSLECETSILKALTLP